MDEDYAALIKERDLKMRREELDRMQSLTRMKITERMVGWQLDEKLWVLYYIPSDKCLAVRPLSDLIDDGMCKLNNPADESGYEFFVVHVDFSYNRILKLALYFKAKFPAAFEGSPFTNPFGFSHDHEAVLHDLEDFIDNRNDDE